MMMTTMARIILTIETTIDDDDGDFDSAKIVLLLPSLSSLSLLSLLLQIMATIFSRRPSLLSMLLLLKI